MQTIDLNIRGQICPSCLLLTLKEVNRCSAEIRSGRVEIVVTTDDRQSTTTIPATVVNMGFNTEVDRIEDGYRIRIYGIR